MSTVELTPFARSRSVRAAIWLTRVRDNSLSARARQQFKRWLLADPANRLAFERIAATFYAVPGTWPALNELFDQETDEACLSGTQSTQQPAARTIRRRRTLPPLVTAFMAIFVLLMATFLWRDDPILAVTGDNATQDLTLADGSMIHLHAHTELTVEFSARRRIVHLFRGEAEFDVAKDPLRPFIVRTPVIQVEAVGTRFAVRVRGDEVVVTVAEGIVAVTPRRERRNAIRLHAGQQLTVYGGQIEKGPVQVPSPFHAPRRLIFQNVSLGEIVEEFNRRYAWQIAIPPEIAQRRVGLAVLLDAPESFIEAIEMQAGISLTRDANNALMTPPPDRPADPGANAVPKHRRELP